MYAFQHLDAFQYRIIMEVITQVFHIAISKIVITDQAF